MTLLTVAAVSTQTPIFHGSSAIQVTRKFHALISDLVRCAWVGYARQQNLDILGEAADGE
jgi:hypothetical protein